MHDGSSQARNGTKAIQVCVAIRPRNLFQESGRNIAEPETYGAYTQASTHGHRFSVHEQTTGNTFNQQIINQKVVVDMSKLTQTEAVSITNGFVTIQTSINVRMYQTQAGLA